MADLEGLERWLTPFLCIKSIGRPRDYNIGGASAKGLWYEGAAEKFIYFQQLQSHPRASCI